MNRTQAVSTYHVVVTTTRQEQTTVTPEPVPFERACNLANFYNQSPEVDYSEVIHINEIKTQL